MFESPGVKGTATGVKGEGKFGFTYDNTFNDYEGHLQMVGGTMAAEGKKPVDDASPVKPKSMKWE